MISSRISRIEYFFPSSPFRSRIAQVRKDLGENVHIIAHGTILEEFRISSVICTAPSAPEKANMGVISPIIKVTPLLSYPPSARKCVQTSPLLLFWGDMTINTTITMTNKVT
jgi:hypothetical protein